MKHYTDYKKLFNTLVLIILLLLPVVFLSAQTAQEIRNKIDEKDGAIEKLEKEIASYQIELNGLGLQKDSLNKSLKELDLTKKKLNADISVTQNKIDRTNLSIQNLSKDIGNKEGSIENNLKAIRFQIRNVNEFEQISIIETILSDDNFSSVWNDIDNIITVREKLRENITILKQKKGELEDTRKVTIDAKAELTSLKSQLSDQQKIVVQNANEKSKLLTQTKNNEVLYQKLVREQLAKKQAFEKELEDYESQLKFILDPSSIPTGRVLSWPLDSIYVTSPYAPRWGGFHRGTDFRASVGTPVKSVADGVVLGTGDTDLACPKASFGKWIFIEHSNGLSSTYAHLSQIKVKKGDKVFRGSIIGYSGNTGSSTGPHLHLSVYVSRDAKGDPAVRVEGLPSLSCLGKTLIQPRAATDAYLDPMRFLPSL